MVRLTDHHDAPGLLEDRVGIVNLSLRRQFLVYGSGILLSGKDRHQYAYRSDASYEEENFYHPPVRDSLDHIDLLESVWKVLDGLVERLHLRLNIFRYRNRNGGRNALNGIFEVVDGRCKLVQPSLDILVGTLDGFFRDLRGRDRLYGCW